MANVNRMIREVTAVNPVGVGANIVVNVGDFLYLSSNLGVAVTALMAGNNAQVQGNAHNAFLGVSLEQHLNPQAAATIAYAADGVWEGPCADEAAKSIGQYYGIAGDGSNAIAQKVQSVASYTLAIGVLTETKAANATSVKLNIFGMTVNAPAL